MRPKTKFFSYLRPRAFIWLAIKSEPFLVPIHLAATNSADSAFNPANGMRWIIEKAAYTNFGFNQILDNGKVSIEIEVKSKVNWGQLYDNDNKSLITYGWMGSNMCQGNVMKLYKYDLRSN